MQYLRPEIFHCVKCCNQLLVLKPVSRFVVLVVPESPAVLQGMFQRLFSNCYDMFRVFRSIVQRNVSQSFLTPRTRAWSAKYSLVYYMQQKNYELEMLQNLKQNKFLKTFLLTRTKFLKMSCHPANQLNVVWINTTLALLARCNYCTVWDCNCKRCQTTSVDIQALIGSISL